MPGRGTWKLLGKRRDVGSTVKFCNSFVWCMSLCGTSRHVAWLSYTFASGRSRPRANIRNLSFITRFRPRALKIAVMHIAGRNPHIPQRMRDSSRASPCQPGSLGSDAVRQLATSKQTRHVSLSTQSGGTGKSNFREHSFSARRSLTLGSSYKSILKKIVWPSTSNAPKSCSSGMQDPQFVPARLCAAGRTPCRKSVVQERPKPRLGGRPQ